MTEKRDISGLVMRVFTVLLCLTLFSMWLMSNMYARYTTEVSSGDSARVAKFSIRDTSTLQETYAVTLVPNEKKEIQIQISNDSEVAVKYIFSFETEGNAPLTIEMKNGAGNTSTENSSADLLTKSDSNTWTVEKEAAGHAVDNYIAEISLSNAGYQYSGNVAMLTLTVKAEQID